MSEVFLKEFLKESSEKIENFDFFKSFLSGCFFQYQIENTSQRSCEPILETTSSCESLLKKNLKKNFRQLCTLFP